jgi:hypothetical protein
MSEKSEGLMDIKGMDKIMETVVKDTYFFTNKELGHHLPLIQLVSFLE